MVKTTSYKLEPKKNTENTYYVRSRQQQFCPRCESRLKIIGSRKRKRYEPDGSKITLIIRRMFCNHCGKIHHELPDSIIPFKRYGSESIEIALGMPAASKSKGTAGSGSFPGENSTVYRLKAWFIVLCRYLLSCHTSIKKIQSTNQKLIEKLKRWSTGDPVREKPGWLAFFMLKISGSW